MQTVKIATWNVAYGVSPTRNARISQTMADVDADVWVLTETHDMLRPPSGGNWECVTSEQRPRQAKQVVHDSRWVAIWSRLPVLERLSPAYDPKRTAAAVVETPIGKLLVFGTVLPWYQDVGRTVKDEFAKQATDWHKLSSSRGDIPVCVAGDYNVNLGGPHYYGSRESQDAVEATMTLNKMSVLTNFERTGAAQLGSFGLIDHISVSNKLARHSNRPQVWQRQNGRGEPMSDHCGVAVTFTL